MALFGKLFKREDSEPEPQLEEFTELPVDLEQKKAHTMVEVDKLEDFTDTDRIIRKVRNGAIVVVGIKDMKERSMEELKHAISKFKTSVSVIDGDIVGVGEEFVILTPANAKVIRTA